MNQSDFIFLENPMQRHIVAWEKAVRALKNEDAKPALNKMMALLETVKAGEDSNAVLVAIVSGVADTLREALKIINDNESATLSSNRGVMVKAAINAGWILAPEIKSEDVDESPAWLIQWVAEQIAGLYEKATTIPKA